MSTRMTCVGLFAGAGGLDLGFELAGFNHILASDIDEWSIKTLRDNRPSWTIVEADIHDLHPNDLPDADVFLAGFPCQGFSLGGNRNGSDSRNYLYKEVVRLAAAKRPRFVVIENVLNLRTMREPITGRPFVDVISESFRDVGYHVKHNIFRVCEFGVPQTRRRFVFIASIDPFPQGFHWPQAGPPTPASAYLGDIASLTAVVLPNHNPSWGFGSSVHVETDMPFDPTEAPVPCRFSRTGSDGHPIRSLAAPFPAIDTATVWGWAQGHVTAERRSKNRSIEKFVRNPQSNVTLWRISASRLRSFTDREYARLQTFPDEWVFHGGNKRHIHRQIGNAVPVEFARRIGRFLVALHEAQRGGTSVARHFGEHGVQLEFDL